MYSFRWVSVLYVFTCVTFAEGIVKTGEACYGTNVPCDYYSLSCKQDEIIRLGTLRYGRKEQPEICTDIENHCLNKSTCCTAAATDCSENFNLRHTYEAHTNCSGRPSCSDVQAPWKLMNCDDSSRTSTYVSLQYECQNASTKLKFCGDKTVTGSRAEAIFDGSKESFDPAKASRKCGCKITNRMDTQTFTVTIIDLRLQSYVRNENNTAKCSSAQFRLPGYPDYICKESLNHELDNFVINSTINIALSTDEAYEILLENLYMSGYDDSPAMIWLSFEASKEIEMYCREIVPLTTTTTITTTMTTPSTTTTMTTPSTTTTMTTPSTTTTVTMPSKTTTVTTPSTTTTITTPSTTTTMTTPSTTTTMTTPSTTTTMSTPSTTTSTTTSPTTTSTTMTPQTTTSTTTTPPTTTSTTTTQPTTTFTTTTQPTTSTTTTPPTTTSTTTRLSTTTTAMTPSTTTTTTTTQPTTASTTTRQSTNSLSLTTATEQRTMASTTTMMQPTTSAKQMTTTPAVMTITDVPNTTSTITTKLTTTQPTSTVSTRTTSITTSTKPLTTKLAAITTTTTSSTTSAGTGQNNAPLLTDGDSKEEQKMKLFLAIFVPLAVTVLIISLFITWLYLRTKIPRNHKLQHNSLKKTRLRDDKKNAKYTMNMAPSYGIKAGDSVVLNGSTFLGTRFLKMPKSSVGDYYEVPKQNHYPTTFIPRPVDDDSSPPIHVKMEYLGNDSPLNSSSRVSSSSNSQISRQPSIVLLSNSPTNADKNIQKDNSFSKSSSQTGVVIYVDNTNGNFKKAVNSTGGIIKSDTEGPAIIVPDVVTNRNSGTAHVLPGDTPDAYSAIFIK